MRASQALLTCSDIQGGPKNRHTILYALTLPIINRLSKLFYCQNEEEICNNTITKGPTTPRPSPPLDNIRVMVIVWGLRGNIIRTAVCWIV